MTSHRERVRPVKERVGSSARDGDGEGGTNGVYASRILGSRLGRPDGFCCSPVGHAVLDVPLEEKGENKVDKGYLTVASQPASNFNASSRSVSCNSTRSPSLLTVIIGELVSSYLQSHVCIDY